MKIYLVRHGETNHNTSKTYQNANSQLSEKGLQQANFLAERFTKIPVDLIISSPYKRTSQTAECINKKINKKIIHSNLLQEIKRPTELEGKSMTDPSISDIREKMTNYFYQEDMHYSDEENFYDLKKRVGELIDYLKTIKEENLVLVTHGGVMRMIVCQFIFPKLVSPELFENIWNTFYITNSGITVLEEIDGVWKLMTWNDYAHLG